MQKSKPHDEQEREGTCLCDAKLGETIGSDWTMHEKPFLG